LRRLRIAAPTQLALVIPEAALSAAQRWFSLPDRAQAEALSLLVRMIGHGVIVDEEGTTDDAER
jgi:hypothetical protein